MERALEWRLDDGPQAKRKCLDTYYRLASETSISSADDDAESVYSIQGKETDVVQDDESTDEEDSSCYSGTDIEVEVEYEVESISGSEDNNFSVIDFDSSGSEDLVLAEGAIAAVIMDSSLEAWETDGETSSASSQSPVNQSKLRSLTSDFWPCVRCKSQNSIPPFRFCEKCFQTYCWQCKEKKNDEYKCFPLCEQCFKIRKTFFPPRPRGSRKRKLEKESGNVASGSESTATIKLETVNSCIRRLSSETLDSKCLSQDSGVSSSQDLPQLDFDGIKVPEHLVRGVKRKISESSESDIFEEVSRKKRKEVVVEERKQSEKNYSSNSEQELCIMCNSNPKNGVFLHGTKGHMCCCYKCALKSWKSTKRCPVCNCKVKNVIKVFNV